jgi:adenine-specific DNA-methyltransferase
MAKSQIEVATLRHQDKRRNIPTAELEPVMRDEEKTPKPMRYARNPDLDPQLVWRGKDDQDWSDLIVQAPPLYIQEKIHPKVLVDDLMRQSRQRRAEANPPMPDLFADFDGLAKKEARTDFYQHDANWSNRMILGDSLSVMASLAEREGLRGKVQCIYLDPPYGVRFNSNFQWSTTSRDVKDGNKDHITREPEQVKAFRDTWRDGIHSYLTYLRDRLTVARDLLADSGSIFVQIGDENVHRVRALMDEVFGDGNCAAQIGVIKTAGASSDLLAGVSDYILWYCKGLDAVKYRQLFFRKQIGGQGGTQYSRVQEPDGRRRSLTKEEVQDPEKLCRGSQVFRIDNMTSQRPPGDFPVSINGRQVRPSKGYWKTGEVGMDRLLKSMRLELIGNTLSYVRFIDDFLVYPINNMWIDTGASGFGDDKIYVVQTISKIIERCILMATDPGDLVLDPTCGSGTTAHVAEQWGRRYITIDTSRVALALSRARIMGARYPYYLLSDSPEGQRKEAEVTGLPPKDTPTHNDIRQGFVYERVPHMTLKSIANNAEIDVIWQSWQELLEPLRSDLNAALGKTWEEWEIPREAGEPWPKEAVALWAFAKKTDDPKEIEKALTALNSALGRHYATDTLPDAPRDPWPENPTRLHADWWEARIARQKEIDASIAAKAEFEYLYDKPYTDNSCIRVAGPLTVESLSPHRVLAVGEDDSLIDTLDLAEKGAEWGEGTPDFAQMVLENLKAAGVQQAHKEDHIFFTSLVPWPGELICAEGRYTERAQERRAAIFLGPEFGIVSRADLVAAAKEAAEFDFNVVVACAFNFDVHSTELDRLGRIPILKARMNPDLHMADALKTTASGNLFVVFGEPDIEIEPIGDDQIRVRIKGVDVFHPQTGEVESGGPETIALWFVDTDYNEESFFIRHAYFLGAATDPYKALRTTLKAEIDEEAWESLRSSISRPFPKPQSGRIAVKVINHLGDEVMKVFAVR